MQMSQLEPYQDSRLMKRLALQGCGWTPPKTLRAMDNWLLFLVVPARHSSEVNSEKAGILHVTLALHAGS